MNNWKLTLGNLLFRFRSFTPVPLIILVFLLFKPGNLGEGNGPIAAAGLLLSLLGETIRFIAVGYSFPGTSGRESHLRADALNTTGIYAVTRNPLYIGNFFMFSGLVTVYANLYALAGFALFLILQYYFIILSEENYLREKYGPEYEAYCSRVRRIFPTFRGYQRNRNPFNLEKVIFKENDSVFNLSVMFLLVLAYKERVFVGRVERPLLYIVPGAILVVLYILVKVIKKRAAAKVRGGKKTEN